MAFLRMSDFWRFLGLRIAQTTSDVVAIELRPTPTWLGRARPRAVARIPPAGTRRCTVGSLHRHDRRLAPDCGTAEPIDCRALDPAPRRKPTRLSRQARLMPWPLLVARFN